MQVKRLKINKGTKIRLKKAVALSSLKSGAKILDLGCGDGRLKYFLPYDIDYVGIDINKSISHNLEKGLPKELLTKKFDVIFMNEFIEHIENFKSLLLECRDILSDDGKIIISTPSNNRILWGDFNNTISEDRTHIHCFRKINMRNLAQICNLIITDIVGTYIRFPPPPFSLWQIIIPTNQTIYTEVIIYRLEKNAESGNQ